MNLRELLILISRNKATEVHLWLLTVNRPVANGSRVTSSSEEMRAPPLTWRNTPFKQRGKVPVGGTCGQETSCPDCGGVCACLGRAPWALTRYREQIVMNTQSKLPYVMLALAIIGIADASYDSYAIYRGQPLWCPPPIDGCNTVANSPYARILGVPLGYLGVVYYLGMAVISALLAAAALSRSLRAVALAYATAGVLSSTVFFYIQANYIRAFCIYCMISALLTVLLFVTSLIHYRRTRNASEVRGGSSARLAPS